MSIDMRIYETELPVNFNICLLMDSLIEAFNMRKDELLQNGGVPIVLGDNQTSIFIDLTKVVGYVFDIKKGDEGLIASCKFSDAFTNYPIYLIKNGAPVEITPRLFGCKGNDEPRIDILVCFDFGLHTFSHRNF